MPRIKYLLLIVCMVCCHSVCARMAFNPYANVPSPDGKHMVRASINLGNYEIINTQTGKVEETFIMYSVPSSVRWTKNSKTIVTIEHRAGGSCMIIMTLKHTAWEYSEPTIPGDLGQHHAGVVHEQVGQSNVRVEYKVTHEKPNGLIVGFYTCAFTIHPDTGAITDVVKRKVFDHTFSRLHDLDE